MAAIMHSDDGHRYRYKRSHHPSGHVFIMSARFYNTDDYYKSLRMWNLEGRGDYLFEPVDMEVKEVDGRPQYNPADVREEEHLTPEIPDGGYPKTEGTVSDNDFSFLKELDADQMKNGLTSNNPANKRADDTTQTPQEKREAEQKKKDLKRDDPIMTDDGEKMNYVATTGNKTVARDESGATKYIDTDDVTAVEDEDNDSNKDDDNSTNESISRMKALAGL